MRSRRRSRSFYKNLIFYENTLLCIFTVQKTKYDKVHSVQLVIHFMLHKPHKNVKLTDIPAFINSTVLFDAFSFFLNFTL
jgi:hypothetical protein